MKKLSYQTKSTKQNLYLYGCTGCNNCPLQSHCTKADKRWSSRHFYAAAFAVAEARLKLKPELMKRPMTVAERPFAQIKQKM